MRDIINENSFEKGCFTSKRVPHKLPFFLITGSVYDVKTFPFDRRGRELRLSATLPTEIHTKSAGVMPGMSQPNLHIQ